MPDLKASAEADMGTGKSSGSEKISSSGPASVVANGLYNFSNAINGVLERAFEALGRLVGRRPVLVIIVSLIVTGILAAGRVNLEKETRGERLWVPDDNESQRNNDLVNHLFPAIHTGESIYLLREDGGDMLTQEEFDKALSIHNEILALQWINLKDKKNPSGDKIVRHLPETQTFQDLCLNEQGGEGADDVLGCTMMNALEIFGYNSTSWFERDELLAALNDPAAWSTDLIGSGFVLEQVLGGVEKSASGDVQGARVLKLTYIMAGNKTLIYEQETDEPMYGWEMEFLDKLEELDEADDTWRVQRMAGRSADDEFGSTLDNDLMLLNIALLAIGIFTYAAISDWQNGCVGSRFLITVGGLLNIGLAYLACEGFAGYIGIFYSDLVLILPFIMLGVGVDGMFVLQGAMDATDPNESMELRTGHVIRTGGLSVAAASVTNFCAFMIGSNTSLPALAGFSIFAALGILFDLFLQITFFAGIMVLDKRRQESRRLDVAMCARSPAEAPVGYCCGAFGDAKEEQSRVRVMKGFGGFLSMKATKLVVIVLWLLLLVGGIVGTSQMKVDADVDDFIPSGSYLRDFLDTTRENFGETGSDISLYWVNDVVGGKVLDFADATVQAQMDTSLDLFRNNEFVVAGTLSSWWEDLKETGGAPGADFYPRLREFLGTETGAKHLGDLVFEDGDTSKQLLAARSAFQWRYIEDTQEQNHLKHMQIDAMESMRDTEDLVPDPLGARSFTHAPEFLNIEQYKSIGREAFMNIGLGFLMIFVVVFFLVANPIAALLTFLCVASAILELVGFMRFRGQHIDSISVIFIVISLGLAVDYSVHVAHAYLSTREDDPVIRLQKTMGQTGSAVFNGALSTLIAALCLSGSQTYAFITFFYSLLFIVVFGAFQGLVVLPVLLDMFRPAYHTEEIPESHAPAVLDHSASQDVRGDSGTVSRASLAAEF